MDSTDALEESANILSQKYYFSSKKNNCSAYLKDDKIYLNDKEVLDINDIKLKVGVG